jgi:CRP/FNR family cyclic AMP-dependent transcriptional regulator
VEILKLGHLISTVTQPGAVFGEVSVLLEQPHMATVRAGTEIVVRVVENPQVFLETNPAIAVHVGAVIGAAIECSDDLFGGSEAAVRRSHGPFGHGG